MKSALSTIALLVCVGISLPAYTQDAADWDDALLSVDLKPGEALILVRIQDDKGNNLPGVIVSAKKGRHGKIVNWVSDDQGQIQIIVPAGNTYTLRFLSLNVEEETHEEQFVIPDENDVRFSLTMTSREANSRKFILEGVNFNTGKATLTAGSYARLANLVEFMKMKTSARIELGGHTDNVGDEEANLRLSAARANAVRDYLIKKGIDGDRITAVGYGATMPVADNDSEAGRRQNRRTEVVILQQ